MAERSKQTPTCCVEGSHKRYKRKLPFNCDHYYNSSESRSIKARKRLKINLLKKNNDNCAICMESLFSDEHLWVLECGHRYHRSCVKEQIKTTNKCGLCRTIIRCDPPEEWYEKYMYEPGFHWLTSVINRRNQEREFEELIEVINLASSIEELN
tara:strand:- start:3577 stop:4038 length:462 start_codon:yes stop_codon:yes gene_type:complete